VPKRGISTAEGTPWKLLLWAALAGLLFGLVGFGEIAENSLRTAGNQFHRHRASGDIVLVKIDDDSLRQVGRWPWPRRYHAQLTDELTKAGAKRIFFDFGFFGPSDAADDLRFASSLQRSGRVVLATGTRSGAGGGAVEDTDVLPMFEAVARSASISWRYNYQNAVIAVPYEASTARGPIPSFSVLLAGRSGGRSGMFMPDYSVRLDSIPAVSASRILDGRFDPGLVRGKDVVIGGTSSVSGDDAFVPGTGKVGGAYVHIIAAETLKSGRPINGGWLPLFLIAVLISTLALRLQSAARRGVTLSATAAMLMVATTIADSYHLFFDVTPALFMLLIVGVGLAWRSYRKRGLVNPVSGLPNLNSLRHNRFGRDQALIAARVLNYEEIVASLPTDQERQLVEQIASRLRVGSPGRILYHGDGGIFAWFEESRQPFGNHLEALYALFRNPARVGGLSIDLTITFGVEVGSGRSLPNRLASALVAADEAAHHGLKWRFHDPESLQNATWKLSMLSRLDEAIDQGEVWVAFQPKLDIASRRIIGAEALARWTHPEKGPIAASEFVAAAEQHDRIGKLTDFVLDKAVAAAAQINKRGGDFDIAVNLSARLLSDKGFTLRLSALLARHGLSPLHLTLELTETAALTDGAGGLEMISRLRDIGVNIAIDDYGTGQSTLEYLKKIPATELKIDQSFVKGVVDNRSDRLMVQSTIGLAHSLGRKVVAEGVEHREILEVLAELDCDVAQGFAIGRPMSLESLIKRIAVARRNSAAA
jgi:EAL domain-containing protein (putative c-di-GMP-specific phosphodiesterase class I)/CHASE2 domain-containing sensor protein